MIVPQWVIDCGYTTLQTWFHLLRPLGRWLGSTTLVRLMNVKTQLVSQQYQWHTCWKSPWKKNKKLELYSPGGICHPCRDIRKELQHCSCNGALKCGVYWKECQLDMQLLGVEKAKKTPLYTPLIEWYLQHGLRLKAVHQFTEARGG